MSDGVRPIGPPVTAPRVYYFGCGKRVGHYWFAPPGEGRELSSSGAVAAAMRTVFGDDIDTGFAPGTDRARDQIEGAAKLTVARGWTVLAWWDRSVDQRGNSNSAIVVDAERDFDQMVALLGIHFPEVLRRQRAPLRLAEAPTS